MRIGCVISDSSQLAWAAECDFDYLEAKGDFILQLSRADSRDNLSALEHYAFEAMTSPLPRELGARIVGNDADHKYALKILTQMLDLSAMIGVRKIVLGCGQARNIPHYFQRKLACQQFIAFIKKASLISMERKQKLSIEPLHRGETNFINSCAEAKKLISGISEVAITVDCYHICSEKLSIDDELDNSKIMHAHTSYLPRGSGLFYEEYQCAFLRKLQEIGCHSISIEERFESKESMYAFLSQLRILSSNNPGGEI
ncbi:sugar phosphate isomerase/epimerase [Erwinia toletana]|uniref:Sugar phosphate isomerase/epimerase n=1 Tax=Winslowiella toletana TaxID=92490 RepID=A0ABS4P426_9GAMM|nr:TIM barrel protein [Winslowiella toletana]MBP2167391.1 sugar phosphate isomerase/epimerase [Winslowiella toletana]